MFLGDLGGSQEVFGRLPKSSHTRALGDFEQLPGNSQKPLEGPQRLLEDSQKPSGKVGFREFNNFGAKEFSTDEFRTDVQQFRRG